MNGIRDDMRDHPLTVAARYTDAAAEEIGLEKAVEAMGLKVEDVFYIAEQRAIRCVAIFSDRPEMKRLLGNTNKPMRVPPLSREESIVFNVAKVAYLDAIVIGWEGKRLSKESDNDGTA